MINDKLLMSDKNTAMIFYKKRTLYNLPVVSYLKLCLQNQEKSNIFQSLYKF